MIFVYVSKNIWKFKLKNTRPFKIYQSCEIIENRFNKIFKVRMVEIKNIDEKNNRPKQWRGTLSLLIKKLKFVKMLNASKLIYRFNTISKKYLQLFCL